MASPNLTAKMSSRSVAGGSRSSGRTAAPVRFPEFAGEHAEFEPCSSALSSGTDCQEPGGRSDIKLCKCI